MLFVTIKGGCMRKITMFLGVVALVCSFATIEGKSSIGSDCTEKTYSVSNPTEKTYSVSNPTEKTYSGSDCTEKTFTGSDCTE